jgi:cholesterol transport system auxiliary component
MRKYLSFCRQTPFRFPVRLPLILCGFLALALLPAGCGKPPVTVYKHLLEYPSPELSRLPQAPEGLKVELFSVAQAFNSPAMIYRPNSFQSEAYRYHRWRVNPGQMVTDFLLRDLRQSRAFAAVFGYDRPVKTRFLLEGAVEEFQEVNAGENWSAALAVNITLLDTTQEEITQRVLFQKNYRSEEPIIDRTPLGLAAAMSRALEKLSGNIITDINRAAWKRIPPQEKKPEG